MLLALHLIAMLDNSFSQVRKEVKAFMHKLKFWGLQDALKKRLSIYGWLRVYLIWYLFGKPSGPPLHVTPSSQRRPEQQLLWSQRASSVKTAFVDAYSAYEAAAAPHDRLFPLSNEKVDKNSNIRVIRPRSSPVQYIYSPGVVQSLSSVLRH